MKLALADNFALHPVIQICSFVFPKQINRNKNNIKVAKVLTIAKPIFYVQHIHEGWSIEKHQREERKYKKVTLANAMSS